MIQKYQRNRSVPFTCGFSTPTRRCMKTMKRVLQDAMNIAGANWRGFTAKSMPISMYYAEIIARNYAHFREAGLPDVDFENMPPWFL